ncbi:MAG: hypothetical protein ACMUJM_25020 [bacterium]
MNKNKSLVLSVSMLFFSFVPNPNASWNNWQDWMIWDSPTQAHSPGGNTYRFVNWAPGHLQDSPYFKQSQPATLNNPQTNDIQTDYLPHLMKGYELYSWPIGDEWYFSLLPGTNRLKSSEEILSIGSDIDSIKSKLGQLPEGEYIFWIDESWLKQVQGATGNFILPDKAIIDEIKYLCEELKLELNVSDHISELSPQIPYFDGITAIPRNK